MNKHDEALVYPAGRRCKSPSCITTLNMYNAGPFCLLHAQKHEARERALEAAVEATPEVVLAA